jgi:hypothetical protein
MLQNLQKTCHLFERISFLESQSLFSLVECCLRC